MGCCHSSQTVQGNDNFISNVDTNGENALEHKADTNLGNGTLHLKNNSNSHGDIFRKP